MLTAPDWALGSRYLRENAPKTHLNLFRLLKNTALAIYSRKPRKNILARLLPVLFPSSFRRMSAWQWSSAWKKPSERP